MKTEYKSIAARARLGLPLTDREKAIFLLFIATDEELKQFLQW